MSKPDFVHLHVHSEYSLLDGANRISDLVKACVADGQGAIALTDHGNMFGAIELYQSAQKSAIKPIVGCEVYIARNSRHEPHNKAKGNGYHHLTLLARNQQGYQNLMELASIAYLEGYHFRPRIDREVLARHAEGLVCLSGCLAGEVSQGVADLLLGEQVVPDPQRRGRILPRRPGKQLPRLLGIRGGAGENGGQH